MSATLKTVLKRYWLIVLYLIWMLIGVLLYAIPINFIYIHFLYTGWLIASLVILTGATLYKYADSLRTWLATMSALLIVLPIVFISTGFLAGNFMEVLHKGAVVHFIRGIKQAGVAPNNYQLRDPSQVNNLKPLITENYQIETIQPDDFDSSFIFIVQFENGIVYSFKIRRPDNIAMVWELNLHQKN